MQQSLKFIFWSAVIFFALALVWVAAQYFNFDQQHHFLQMKPFMLNNPIWVTAFYVHLAFGILAVLSGLPLFFERLIAFRSRLHKNLGKTYILAILFFTGPTGFYLSFQAEGGLIATVGFLIMSFLWMFITYKAFWWIAVKKDIDRHVKWMIRSYCFTLSGVTLRVFTPIAMNYLDWDAELTLKLAAFLPWIINLSIGELIILIRKQRLKQLTNQLVKE